MCVVWVAIGVIFSLKVVWVPAPLEVALTAGDGNYAVGTDVYGIKWESGMSDLSIAISNHTAYDYDGLDITLRPDVPTREIAQVTNVADVSTSVIRKTGAAEYSDIRITAKDATGNVLGNGPTLIYASGAGFRMRCPKLPSDTTLELLVALVNPKVGRSQNGLVMLNGDPSTFSGPKIRAKYLYANGQYSVLKRPHHLEYTYAIK